MIIPGFFLDMMEKKQDFSCFYQEKQRYFKKMLDSK